MGEKGVGGREFLSRSTSSYSSSSLRRPLEKEDDLLIPLLCERRVSSSSDLYGAVVTLKPGFDFG